MRSGYAYRWVIIPVWALILLLPSVLSAASTVQARPSALDRANSLWALLAEANATVVKVFRQLDAKGIPAPQDSVVDL
jgi:hypothetical protein